MLLSKAKGRRAPTGLMANNLIASPQGPLVVAEIPADKLSWEGNLLYGPQEGASLGAMADDPLMQENTRLLRPNASGPAANRAVEIRIDVRLDIDGQSRRTRGETSVPTRWTARWARSARPPLSPPTWG